MDVRAPSRSSRTVRSTAPRSSAYPIARYCNLVGRARRARRLDSPPNGRARCPQRAAAYGISILTLKNRRAAFVGQAHAVSVKPVLPKMV